MLAAEVASNCMGGYPMPIALKLIVALNFYASGLFQPSTGDRSGVSQSSAHHCIKLLTDAIFRCANQFIKFKVDAASQAERPRSFSATARFPMVQGIIYCTHVIIIPPTRQSGAFINRKGFHSMYVVMTRWGLHVNVQIVCDQRKGILQVCDRYPGSSHDAFILWNSQLPALFIPPECLQGWVLGGRGYPLKTWLMTPARNPRNEAEKHYNESHATTRVTREQTIGLLKMRFRFLDCSGDTPQYSPARVSRIVVIYCALHVCELVLGAGTGCDAAPSEVHSMSSDGDG
ncbi:putative nuclease HARBI1 [Heterodontus francisci]|uniref:putative nuclease HARBI1 n=1 Tax=Heterodontus francisci TaxID=7792 RepID=UPI00355C4C8D